MAASRDAAGTDALTMRPSEVTCSGGMPSQDTLRSILASAFPDARVEVSDLTGTSDHFQATVVTPAFRGKTRIEQHKMVYAALGELMVHDIHALALTTRTE
jgi:stress-induced morphogen